MSEVDKTFCKGCNASIRYVSTKTGKWMPIDFDPKHAPLFADGNIPDFDPKTMKSHFATCPQANSFRKPT